LKKANSSSAVIKALIDKNILEEFFIQQDRVDFHNHTQIDLLLSEVQEKAYDAIKSNFVQKEVCLLHM
jgi:primosomal protein N' (replication factor Y)